MTIIPSLAGGLCGGFAAALVLRSNWRDFGINLALGGIGGLVISTPILPLSEAISASAMAGFALAAFAGAAAVLVRMAYR